MNDDVIATKEEQKRFARFLQELREKGRSPRTLRAYEFDWSQFAGWYAEVNQEPFTLERLAAMDVQDYMTWGRQQGLKANDAQPAAGLAQAVCSLGRTREGGQLRDAPAHQGHSHSEQAATGPAVTIVARGTQAIERS